MGKKKKRSGGGGGGGQQQQQEHEAEERDDKPCADAEKGDDAAAGCEGKEKDKEKPEDKDEKVKEKGGGAGGCKDDKGKEKEKKAPPPLPVVTAVLKVDMHCDGCARRIRASVRRYAGVEGVAMEVDKGSMTVVGRFDAKKLRDRVAKKTRKTVELVGNKGGGGGGDKGGGCGGGEGKQEADKNESAGEKKDGDKCGGGGGNAGKGKGGKDNKKPAVPVIVTVVLKIGSVGLHCDGCMRRIRSKLFKIKGVEQVRMDLPKNQVTVVGTMDAKALPEKLRKKLRRPVDAVPAGKDKDGKQQQQQQQQQQQGDSKEGCGKDAKQQGDGKQSKEAAEKAIAAELELWKTAYYDSQGLQATQFLLSDENPNACAVM